MYFSSLVSCLLKRVLWWGSVRLCLIWLSLVVSNIKFIFTLSFIKRRNRMATRKSYHSTISILLVFCFVYSAQVHFLLFDAALTECYFPPISRALNKFHVYRKKATQGQSGPPSGRGRGPSGRRESGGR